MSTHKKNKGAYVPHQIRLSGSIGTKVYQHRVEMMAELYPKIKQEEESSVFGVAHVMNQLVGDIVIEHPVYGFKCVLNDIVGPSAAYLISCGRYAESFLKSVRMFIKKGDNVLNIGGGFGLTATLCGLLSERMVVAVEPYKPLHAVILKNAKHNNIHIKPVHGCIVPGEMGGHCSFFVDDDVWSSSIYRENVNESEMVQVPILNIESLVKEHRADTLLVNVQGGEICLLTEKDKLKGVKKIIVHVHPAFEEKGGVARIVNEFLEEGFALKSVVQNTCVLMRE